ncbi:MAG: hypothetical protein NZ108_10000, partial [Bacteroidia bacterium]|nr:hypothetical protein [Bacteroidia bacterium]
MLRLLITCLISIAVFVSCKKGELLPNLPPETSVFLDTIALVGQNRLNSLVTLHWTGEDAD